MNSKLEQLQTLRPLSREAVRSLMDAFAVRMNYESNAIEGNSLTLRETDLVLHQGVTVAGKPLRDHLDVVNLAVAWDFLQELAQPNAAFSERDLLDLHRIILTRVNDAAAGVYRDHAVQIRGATHQPPLALKIPELMRELFAQCAEISCPREKAAKLHHGIAAIHPFSDGNGRSARLAMNFVLLAAGFPPVSIVPTERAAYYDALEKADAGDFPAWQAWLDSHLERELDAWISALQPHILS